MAIPVYFVPEGYEGPGRPVNYVHPECYDLPTFEIPTTFEGQPSVDVISAWQLNFEERQEFERTGIIYLRVIGGQPPIEISATNPLK